jgi:hypothetical protein
MSNLDILSRSRHQPGTSVGARSSHATGASGPVAQCRILYIGLSRQCQTTGAKFAMYNLQYKRVPHVALNHCAGPTITHLTKPLSIMGLAPPPVGGLPESKLCPLLIQ